MIKFIGEILLLWRTGTHNLCGKFLSVEKSKSVAILNWITINKEGRNHNEEKWLDKVGGISLVHYCYGNLMTLSPL